MPFRHSFTAESFKLHFVAVGPQRTGTSWLQQLLRHHPQLCLPPGLIEPMFFDLYYEQGLARYLGHFAHRRSDQYCGEVSPTYFDVEFVPARIRRLSPACKIIINLRDPISRAVSLYRHHLSKGRVSGSFTQAGSQMPRLVEAGRYARHIPPWLDTFGADGVTFVLLDDIRTRPELALKQIYSFLAVANVEMPRLGYDKVNALTRPCYPCLAKLTAQLVTRLQAGGFYKLIELGKMLGLKKFVYSGGKQPLPTLTPGERDRLVETYEADIVFLENLLGRDLSAWRQVAGQEAAKPDRVLTGEIGS